MSSFFCNFPYLHASRHLNLDKYSWKEGVANKQRSLHVLLLLTVLFSVLSYCAKSTFRKTLSRKHPATIIRMDQFCLFLQPYPADTRKWTEILALLCSQVIDNCLNKTKEILQSLDFQKDSANLYHSYWLLVLPSSCSIKSTACSEIMAETGNE